MVFTLNRTHFLLFLLLFHLLLFLSSIFQSASSLVSPSIISQPSPCTPPFLLFSIAPFHFSSPGLSFPNLHLNIPSSSLPSQPRSTFLFRTVYPSLLSRYLLLHLIASCLTIPFLSSPLPHPPLILPRPFFPVQSPSLFTPFFHPLFPSPRSP